LVVEANIQLPLAHNGKPQIMVVISAFVGAHTSHYQTPRLGLLTSRSFYKSLLDNNTESRRLTSGRVGRSKSCELTNAGEGAKTKCFTDFKNDEYLIICLLYLKFNIKSSLGNSDCITGYRAIIEIPFKLSCNYPGL